MRAIVLEERGGPEVLEMRDIPDPVAGPDELLVDVAWTALNRADMLQRMGFYPQPGPKPDHEVPCLEFAGTVSGLGGRVEGWAVGDRVMGIVNGGAAAEKLVIPHREAMPIPESISMEDAAAIPEVWTTAYDALVLQGGLSSGRWALVHAGGSGVGTAAIQICKAIGAHIIVTCSSGKVDRCMALGADRVVDYGSEDFAEAVAETTGGRGVDVVLDVIGGEYLERNIDSLMVTGKIIQVGVMGEGKADFPLGKLLPKRASLIGTVLRARPAEQKAAVAQKFIAEILPLFEQGKALPVIDRRFTIDEIGDAHTYMATNQSFGKIMIHVAAAHSVR